MAELDVSEVLDDPLFSSAFILKRSIQNIGDNGRVINDTTESDEQAVICTASADDLARVPDAQYGGRAGISVVTRLRLRGPVQVEQMNSDPAIQYQPDMLFWQGADYVVKHIDIYTHYGSGFIQAIALSTTTIEPPPV